MWDSVLFFQEGEDASGRTSGRSCGIDSSPEDLNPRELFDRVISTVGRSEDGSRGVLRRPDHSGISLYLLKLTSSLRRRCERRGKSRPSPEARGKKGFVAVLRLGLRISCSITLGGDSSPGLWCFRDLAYAARRRPETLRGEIVRVLGSRLLDWTGREHGALSFRLTQILTGHGVFDSYLARIDKEQTMEREKGLELKERK